MLCSLSVLYQQNVLTVLSFCLPAECVLNFGKVAGKCHVIFSENLYTPVAEWTIRGPNRFYFSQAYNSVKQTFEEPPFHATSIGMQGKVR
jgi:DNA (cytosine-5)-methyltransferase 1